MKRLKLFPKIFLYTLGIMLFVAVVTHGLIYLLAPRMQLAVNTPDDVVISIKQSVAQFSDTSLEIRWACLLNSYQGKNCETIL